MNLGLKSEIFVFDKMIFDVPKIEFQLFQIKHILDRFPLAGFNGFRNLKSTINLTKVYGFFHLSIDTSKYWHFLKILIMHEKFIRSELYRRLRIRVQRSIYGWQSH